MAKNDKAADRTKTTWAETNDLKGKTEVIDPNKGPKRRRK